MKNNYDVKRLCPICGNKKGEPLYRVQEILPVDVCLPSEFWIVECNQCGFCYADTDATQNMYDEYYKNSNIYSGRSKKKAPVYEQIMKKVITEHVDKNARILDMGCGNGAFLESLLNTGYSNLYGMDVSVDIDKVLEKIGITGKWGGVYESVSEEDIGKYDIVCLNCVLEHLLFPRKAINNVKQYLNADGILLIVVPDMDNLGYGNRGPAHHFHHEHINYFTVDALELLMEMEGFSCVHVERICENMGNDNEALFVGLYQCAGGLISTKGRIDEAGKLREYLDDYSNDKERERIISEELAGNDIVLYGMGAKMFQALANSSLVDMNIVRCIDGSKARIGKQIILGEKSYIIESADCTLNKEAVICICVNSKQYECEIINTIKEKGFMNRVIVLP